MTPEEIKRYAPRASKSCIEVNCGASGPKSKRPLRNGPLAEKESQKGNSGKRLVSIKSFRVRATDPDNLCGKWHVDAIRYAGIIPNDTAEDIVYQISQKKVSTKKEEKTLIEVSVI